MSVQITPQFILQFEDNLQYLFEDTWASVLQELVWDRFMRQMPSSGRTEYYSWMLNAAGIQPLDNGGRFPLEDLFEVSHKIENEEFGTALELERNSIEDADGKGIQRGAQWAQQIAGEEAYWPQDGLFRLIEEGEDHPAYDGVSFFHPEHPTNPVLGPTAGTYSNVLTNAPLTPSNFARAIAYIKTIRGPNHKPRKLIPRTLVVSPYQELTAKEILVAQTLGRDGPTEFGAQDNVLRTYGFGPPVAAHELTVDGHWYIGCEVIGYALPAFIYQVRRPFKLNSFSHLDQAQLDVMKKFRWTFDGRNQVEYGHPFLFFKFKPTGPGLSLDDFETIVT